jgi:beta-barrel assembly-enhancing protease
VVLVTGDLIELAKTPDELSAVIAHEVAHVERRHVMQGVWRSLGLGLVLDAVVGGGTGADQQAVLLMGSVTDLRFSRRAVWPPSSIGWRRPARAPKPAR